MNKTVYNNYLTPSHPTAFGSVGTLQRHAGLSQAEAARQLSNIDSYTQHREFHKPKYRNPIFVYSLREMVQMDLFDVRHLSEHNDSVNYILSAIDCFSRYSWVVPLVHKNADSSLAAIKSLVETINPPIRGIFFDRGKISG
jgi:hypothetical protein